MKKKRILSLFLMLTLICIMLPRNEFIAKGEVGGKVIEVSSADNFRTALTGAANGDTIKLSANIDLGTNGGIFNGNIAIILDLNGYTITYSGNKSAICFGDDELTDPSLTIKDTRAQIGGGITATGIGGAVISNEGKGTLTIERGTLRSEQSAVIFSNRGGDMTIRGGRLLAPKGNAIRMTSGHLRIEGGELAVTSDQYSTIFFLNHDEYGIGTFTMTGGVVSATGADAPAILLRVDGVNSISGGTISAVNEAALIYYGIGKVMVSTGASLISDSSNKESGTIYLNYKQVTGTVLEINGATIINTAGGNAVCNLTNGEIAKLDTTNVTGAIVRPSEQPIVKVNAIGRNTDESASFELTNTDSFTQGDQWMVYESKTATQASSQVAVTVTGSALTLAASGSALVPSTYYVAVTQNGLDESFRTELVVVEPFVAIGAVKYPSLQAAFDAAQSSDTIKLLNDFSYNGSDMSLTGDKNIILDLGGNTLSRTSGYDSMIVVEGGACLTITDSSVSHTGKIITINGGALKIGTNGLGKVLLAGGTISSEGIITVDINGILEIKDCRIEGKAKWGYAILNNGTVNMTGGIIITNNDIIAVHNYWGSNFRMSGGQIISTGDAEAIYSYVANETIVSGGSVIAASGAAISAYYAPVTITGGIISSEGTNAILSTGDALISISQVNDQVPTMITSSGAPTQTYPSATILIEPEYAMGNRTLLIKGGTITNNYSGSEKYAIYMSDKSLFDNSPIDNGPGIMTIGDEPVLNGAIYPSYKALKGITLDSNALSLTMGASAQLHASITPVGATYASSVTWSSDNEAVVTVDKTGLVSAKSLGQATITAKTVDGDYAVSCLVIVGQSSGGGGDSGVINPGGTASTPAPNPTGPITDTIDDGKSIDEKGNVIVSLTDKDIADAIQLAQTRAAKQSIKTDEITMTIHVTTDSQDANTVTVNISKNSFQKIINNKIAKVKLVVDSSDLIIGMNLAAVTEINKQAKSDVQISVALADTSELGTEAKKALGSRPVYDLNVNYKNGSKRVTDFGAGSVSVEIPYKLQVGESAGNLCAVYVDASGKVNYLQNSSYVSKRQVFVFTTSHFSVYGIGYKTNTQKYNDIANHWAKDDIDFITARGLLSATHKGKFDPDAPITRAMFVTALGRLADVNVKGYKKSSFSDVKTNAYYSGYIEWAAKYKILTGKGDKYDPNGLVTREQMAAVMTKYAEVIDFHLPDSHTQNTFADNSEISTVAASSVKELQMAGIIQGKSNNIYDPKGKATRAEVSAMLRRFVELTIINETTQGWTRNDSGEWMYYENGKPVTGKIKIDGVMYKFNKYGCTIKGPKA